MADNNNQKVITNSAHIDIIGSLCEQIGEHIREISPRTENESYEKENARKGLNWWQTHELHELRKVFK